MRDGESGVRGKREASVEDGGRSGKSWPITHDTGEVPVEVLYDFSVVRSGGIVEKVPARPHGGLVVPSGGIVGRARNVPFRIVENGPLHDGTELYGVRKGPHEVFPGIGGRGWGGHRKGVVVRVKSRRAVAGWSRKVGL
jgi:hypothetical protein